MLYVIQICLQAVSKSVWHIPLLCVQWKTPPDGQRNCTKHVDFYSKNKFEKLVRLVGFIIRIFTIYGHLNVIFSSNLFEQDLKRQRVLQYPACIKICWSTGLLAKCIRKFERFINWPKLRITSCPFSPVHDNKTTFQHALTNESNKANGEICWIRVT